MAIDRTCNCGSGELRYALTDARGIFCAYVCEACEAEKRKKYRPEIFSDSGYWTDEPISEDEGPSWPREDY